MKLKVQRDGASNHAEYVAISIILESETKEEIKAYSLLESIIMVWKVTCVLYMTTPFTPARHCCRHLQHLRDKLSRDSGKQVYYERFEFFGWTFVMQLYKKIKQKHFNRINFVSLAYRLRKLFILCLENLEAITVDTTVHDDQITNLIKTFGQERNIFSRNRDVIQKHGSNLLRGVWLESFVNTNKIVHWK